MRIELPAAPAPAPVWRPPEQALTLTFRPEQALELQTQTLETLGEPTCKVQVEGSASTALVITLR